MFKYILVLSLTLCLTENLFAAPSEKELEKVRKEILLQQNVKDEMKKKADAIEAEIMDHRQKMIKAAKTIQEYEEKISAYEIELEELQKRYIFLGKKLKNHNEQIINIVAAMENLSLHPLDTMIFMPMTPTEILRSGIILREAVPMVKNSAEKVVADLNEVKELRKIIENQYREIKISSRKLNEKSAYMDSLLKHKRQLQKKFEDKSIEAEKKSSELAQKASDLKELLDRLNEEKQRRKKELAAKGNKNNLPKNNEIFADSNFAKALGQLPYPIRGNIIKRYGETNETGMQNRGVTIKGRKGARVIAPYDGTVLFSGPFRGYGEMVIIDHSENYMTLLAGMERIDISVGQALLAGEPVGVMSSTEEPTLYMEIRRDGHPVNPLPWLISENKAN